VEFTLHGREVARMTPVFKVKDWTGPAPQTILLDGKTLAGGTDFVASARNGILLLQVLRNVETDARIVIGKSPAPPEKAPATEVAKEGAAGNAGAVEDMLFGAVKVSLAAGRDSRISLIRNCAIADGRTALRIDIQEQTWRWGLKKLDPAKAVWDGCDYLTFDVFNPQKDMNSLVLTITGEGVKGGSVKWTKEMLFRPGMNRVELRLPGASVDWKKPVSEWEFSQMEMATSVGTGLYLMNFRLEREAQVGPPEKGVNVVRIEADARLQRMGDPGGNAGRKTENRP